MNFREFRTLKESADLEAAHQKHLNHIEENVFHSKAGAEHAIAALHEVNKMLKHELNDLHRVSTKSDGSVSVVFGHHPVSKRFFVATKSAFNKNPKINFTEDDIEQNHGHAPGLVHVLKQSLKHLPKISPVHGVYQSDLMFHEGSKVKTKDGFEFQPNTIKYSVDKQNKNHDSIKNAKIGFAVHTKYEGVPEHAHTLEGMRSVSFDSKHELNHHRDVHVTDSNFYASGISGHHGHEAIYHLTCAKNINNSIENHKHSAVSKHLDTVKTYYNTKIKNSETPSFEDFKEHVNNKLQKEVDKVKTEKTKLAKTEIKNKTLGDIEDNKDTFKKLMQVHDHVQHAKNLLVDSMNSAQHAYDHSIDGQRANPEGYVGVHKNIPFKLVNRKEFSRANFEHFKKRKEANAAAETAT